MKSLRFSLIIIFSFFSLAVPSFLHLPAFAQTTQQEPHVQTHSDEYTTGDGITISGNTGGSGGEPRAQLQILNPDGDVYKSALVQVAPDGSFVHNTIVGGKQGINGTYHVVITYDERQAETTFEFATSGTLLDVTVDGESYHVRARALSDHASWEGISVDPESKSLVIEVEATEPDTAKIELDRSLIDTISNCYIVHINDQPVESSCMPIDGQTILLTLQLPTGSNEVRITGSYVVPEFGILTAAVIMAIATVGIIVASSRYQKFRV
jgi:hypothetical protein